MYNEMSNVPRRTSASEERRRRFREEHQNGKMTLGTVCLFLTKVVLVAAFALSFFYVITTGLQRQGLVTCHKLETYSQTYRTFYLTEAEKAMCDELGVLIDAPVK